MRRTIPIIFALFAIFFASCTNLFAPRENVVLRFSPYTTEPFTRAQQPAAEVFSKLNIMLFDSAGEKVFDKVRTQTAEESGFGTLALTLAEGTYTVVAVGHSSKISATIKSPESVQFTASDGEKLTDTFNYCGQISVTSQRKEYALQMSRVVAMFRLRLTDKTPATVAKMKFDYSGGSANYNPSTGQGNTKSSQSETRAANDSGVYEIYTFPYLSETGVLSIAVSALDASGSILLKRTFSNVPVRVNTITSYEGAFFGDMPGGTTDSPITFTADPEWASTNTYTF